MIIRRLAKPSISSRSHLTFVAGCKHFVRMKSNVKATDFRWMSSTAEVCYAILRKPAAFPNTLLGGIKITDIQGSIITLQYGIFNPGHCSSESHVRGNSSKDVPTNGYIHHNTTDVENYWSGFETTPCMAGTSGYIFLTLAGDDVKTISPELHEQLQCIRDVNAKLRKCLHLYNRCISNNMMEQLPQGDPLSHYRYFLPIQTRVADSNPDSGMLFYVYADTIINNYLFWHCDFAAKMSSGEGKHMMVHTEHNFRSRTDYPQVLLGAARVERLGNSSVTYGVAFYNPKLDYQSKLPTERTDSITELGISLHGQIVEDLDILKKLQTDFTTEPSSFGKLVHSFLDSTGCPLKVLPPYIKSGMERILVPKSTL